MIEEYSEDNGCSRDDAADFISYNTLGALQPSDVYEKMPIVMASSTRID